MKKIEIKKYKKYAYNKNGYYYEDDNENLIDLNKKLKRIIILLVIIIILIISIFMVYLYLYSNFFYNDFIYIIFKIY